MNNKEFITTLAKSLDIKEDNAESGVTMLVRALTDLLSEKENTVLKLKNFGSFEIKKREERFAVNPSTKQKMLVPPKLTFIFHSSPSLKTRLAATSETKD